MSMTPEQMELRIRNLESLALCLASALQHVPIDQTVGEGCLAAGIQLCESAEAEGGGMLPVRNRMHTLEDLQ